MNLLNNFTDEVFQISQLDDLKKIMVKQKKHLEKSKISVNKISKKIECLLFKKHFRSNDDLESKILQIAKDWKIKSDIENKIEEIEVKKKLYKEKNNENILIKTEEELGDLFEKQNCIIQ